MKIAINALYYTSWQGIEVFLSNLINAWPNNPDDEVVVFANQKSAEFLRPLPDYIRLEIKKFKKLDRLRLFLYQQTTLPAILKKEKFDLLFCPSLIAPWFYRKKIITIHDAAPFIIREESGFLGRIFWQINLFFGLRSSLKIVTVSEFSRQELIIKLKIKADEIEIIRNGAPRPSNILPRQGIINPYQDSEYLVAVGNSRPRKNLISLLRAFIILAEQFPNLKLILIGKYDKRMAEIQKVSNQLGAKNIVFPGFINEAEKNKIIRDAKALILPSLYEGFGLPIIEANALDTPVACSDIPAFREIANDAALFFAPLDKNDIALKIKNILEYQSLADNLITAGRANIRRFDWRKSATSLIKLIHCHENTRNQ
ncbi:MAG: glycosyltransferase family 1 protein [Patescibacteria group bacterium]